jgi:hypothetical protein
MDKQLNPGKDAKFLSPAWRLQTVQSAIIDRTEDEQNFAGPRRVISEEPLILIVLRLTCQEKHHEFFQLHPRKTGHRHAFQ